MSSASEIQGSSGATEPAKNVEESGSADQKNPALSPPSPEQLRINRLSHIAKVAGQSSQQVASWIASACNCADLGDQAGFEKHLEIAEGLAIQLVTGVAVAVDWKKSLDGMRAAGSKPGVALAPGVHSVDTGEIACATWWSSTEAKVGGRALKGQQQRDVVCVVFPVKSGHAEAEKPKLVIAQS